MSHESSVDDPFLTRQENEASALLRRLEVCACSGVVDELDSLAGIAVESTPSHPKAGQFARRKAPRLIRKLAHRKYLEDFWTALLRFRAIANATSDQVLKDALGKLEKIATARFSYDPEALDSRKETST